MLRHNHLSHFSDRAGETAVQCDSQDQRISLLPQLLPKDYRLGLLCPGVSKLLQTIGYPTSNAPVYHLSYCSDRAGETAVHRDSQDQRISLLPRLLPKNYRVGLLCPGVSK